MIYRTTKRSEAEEIRAAVKYAQAKRAVYWQRMLDAARGIVELKFIPTNQVY